MDEDAARLALALGLPAPRVEAALAEVGVDAPYLARALLEGDPQGAIASVGQRLAVPRRELVLALIRMGGATAEASRQVATLLDRAEPDGRSGAEIDVLRAFVGERLPRTMRRTALAGALLGAALLAFGSMAFWNPGLFRAALLYAVAGLVLLVAVLLLATAWRLQRAAASLRRLADRFFPPRKG